MRRPRTVSRKPSSTRRRKTANPKRNSASNAGHRTTSSVAHLQKLLARQARELEDARKERAAISEVLRVISSSPVDLQPVFEIMLEKAVKICDAKFGNLWLREGNKFRIVAIHGGSPEYQEYLLSEPLVAPDPQSAMASIARERKVVQIEDISKAPTYGMRMRIATIKIAKARTLVGVPMLKDDEIIGIIAIYRQEKRSFTEKQVSLLINFANQAVIAIGNAQLLNELRQRTADLTESLEQQTATSEILGVISSSPTNVQPVLDTIVRTAVTLCESHDAVILLREGDHLRIAAHYGPMTIDFERALIGRDWVSGRVVMDRRPVHVHDLTAEGGDFPLGREIALRLNQRTVLGLPLSREGQAIGCLFLRRTEVRPFSEKQVGLLQTFADQAVIAIENARLFEAEQRRTQELTESLDRQTATSEVLRAISNSPGELEPVFKAILENAARLCQAQLGTLNLYDGDTFRTVALYNPPPEFANRLGEAWRPHPESGLAYVARRKEIAHIDDIRTQRPYLEGNKAVVDLADLAGARTLLIVPMLNKADLVGTLAIYRQEVRPFGEKQVDLLKSFASQAVIAIENVRLLNQLRDSLQRQTATADVLKVISRSTFDLQTVLDTLTGSAARLCSADNGVIFQRDGDLYRFAANYGFSPAAVRYAREHPLRPSRGSMTGRVALEGRVIHIPDVLADPEYRSTEYQRAFGYRTNLGVPLLREGSTIGVFSLTRKEVKPFTEEQIELVTTFADQAVIAIENARLLNELRDSLQQQTATADVLKVISRSTFDLQAVLRTLVESAAKLCDADKGTITRQIGDTFYRAESYGFSSEFMEYARSIPVVPERGSVHGRALLDGIIVHIRDVQNDPEYTFLRGQKLGDFRTVLGVPMLREGVPIGVLALTRSEVKPFTDKQIELVSTFADQAAIAIENARLFEAEQARTRELAESLEDLRIAQDRLVQTQKLASLGQLTAGIAHEIKNPLNFINNFSSVSVELIDELEETLTGVNADDKARTAITELTNTLRGNLDKVVQHGRRADSIVRNMLLHSREGSGEHRPVDVNALVEEAVNLAYHGARAEKQGFNITLERSFDPAAGKADLFPQEITRVLLNVIANGFYAASKRKGQTDGEDYEPILAAATKNLGDNVEITIRDNGMGIPPEVREKMFNPFFTTKPAGEGTGLGLSISHDIIVKQHAGSIEVDTRAGEFTEIRIILPRAASRLASPRA